MSNSAAKLALVEPVGVYDRTHTEQHYPRSQVWWSALAFCLSIWGVVILAVTHYA
jgi:hypothetical protein